MGLTKEEIAKLVGGQVIAPKLDVDILKFNGQSGEFTKLIKRKDGEYEKEKIAGIQGVVIKVRRTLNAFSKNEVLYTNEHNAWGDTINLFQKNEGKKSQMIDKGDSEFLRGKYQQLRLQQILYMLVDGKIYKLSVKGKSLSGLFNYYKENQDEGKHIFENEVIIKSHKEESKLGMYYAMDFKRGEETNTEEISETIKEISDKIQAIDDFYKSEKQTGKEEIVEEVNVDDINSEIPIEPVEPNENQ